MPSLRIHSIATAADELGVSKITIRRLITGGELPAYKVRGAIRIKHEDLVATMHPVTVRPAGDAA